MFRFYINNQLIEEEPEGVDNITPALRFDRDLKGLFTVLEVSLTFIADGYQILKTAYSDFGYCYNLPIEIRQRDETDGNFYPIFNGIIFLKNVEFNEGIEGFSAKCKIEDNSFFARIYNNRNIKARVYGTESKNGLSIYPATPKRINFFKPSDCSYIGYGSGYDSRAFKVYDVLKYLVSFMSDNEIDFYSDTFGAGGKYENYLITCGYVIRTLHCNTAQELFEKNFPDLSFSECFQELNKEFNIGFVAGYDGGRPYMRIEEFSYLFPETSLADFSNVDNLKITTATEYLYATLRIGSSNINNDLGLGLSFPEDIRFIGFKDETYYLTTDCNTDAELNLVNDWIISSNVIEDLVINGDCVGPALASTSLDNTIALVHCIVDSGNDYFALQTNWLNNGGSLCFYNESLNTNNKASRYLGAIPANIAAQLGVIDNSFLAKTNTPMDETITNPGVFNPVDFSIEIYDYQNNYTPTAGNYCFTAPVGGVYTFNFKGTFGAFAGAVHFDAFIDLYNNADTPGVDPPIYSKNISPYDGTQIFTGLISFDLFNSVNMSATNKAALRVITYLGTGILPGSTFGSNASSTGGGLYATYNPEEMPIVRIKFEAPIGFSQYRNIQTVRRGLIGAGVKDGKKYNGWIEEMKYKSNEGITQTTLISNLRLNK